MEIVQNLWQVGGGDMTAPEDTAIYPIIYVIIRIKIIRIRNGWESGLCRS
jgi:hypothetical protein